MASTRIKNFTAALDTSLREHSLAQLNSYFSEVSDCSDVFNKTTVISLTKVLKRDGKHEDRSLPVKCVLTCLQHFLDSNVDGQVWQQVSEEVCKLLDTTFALSVTYIEDEVLVQKCTSLFTDIVECSEGLAESVLKYMMRTLLKTATAEKFAGVRFDVVSFLSVLLQKSSRELRKEVVPANVDLLVKLSDTLVSSGNYELQATTVEVLARCRIFLTDLQHSGNLFPSNSHIRDMFHQHMFLSFDSECRLFLNEVNKSLAPNKLVYSLPSMIIVVDDKQLRKPTDPQYLEFWVDFNTSPASISFYFLEPSEPSTLKDTWDTLEIYLDNVTHVTAKKSQCRAKNSSSVIDAVKLEVRQPITPEYVKIYLSNDKAFQTVETKILKQMLKDRYQSEIVYSSLPINTSETTSSKPVKSPDGKSARFSFANMSTRADEQATLEMTQKTVMDESHLGNPSPLQNSTCRHNISSSYENLLKTLEDSDSNGSNSFIHYKKKQEALVGKGKASGGVDVAEDDTNNPAQSENQSKLMYDNNKSKDNLRPKAFKNRIENVKSSKTPYINNVEGNEENNFGQNKQKATTSILKSKSKEITKNVVTDEEKNSLNGKQEDKGTNNLKECLKNQSIETDFTTTEVKLPESRKGNVQKTIFKEKINYPKKSNENLNIEDSLNNNIEKQPHFSKKIVGSNSKTVEEQISDKITKVATKNQNEGGLSNKNCSQVKDTQKSSVGKTSVSRKRLYTPEKNDALIFSSQDDILSVDVPAYKITKRETKPKPQVNPNRKNVTYSYINFKDKNQTTTKENNEPSLYIDEKDLEEEQQEKDDNNKESKTKKHDSLHDQTSHFKYSFRNEKKLQDLNKTPENTKSSNLFPTLYSDFSASVKKPDVKKTYTRPKPKRGRKRFLLPMSSNSDSDYEPGGKVSPKFVENRGRRGNKISRKKPSGFSDRFEKPRIDPTRDCSSPKSRRIEVEQVPFEERIETRVIFQKETSKVLAKKGKGSNTSRIKAKTTCSEEDVQVEQMSEDVGRDCGADLADMDLMPCEINEINKVEEDDWDLDKFHNTSSEVSCKMKKIGLAKKQVEANNLLNKVHTFAHKQREKHICAFEHQVQSSSVGSQLEQLRTASKSLASTMLVLESTSNLLKETTAQLEVEAASIENAKKELRKNLSQADKQERSHIASIFQGFGRYMKNVVLSLLSRNQGDKKPS